MKESFRSRGVRVRKGGPERGLAPLQSKRYYDIEPKILRALVEGQSIDRRLSCFEYSLDASDSIDSLNFHVALDALDDSMYIDQTGDVLALIHDIPRMFDSSFQNYTIGYRLKDGRVSGKTFYFYPTIRRGDGFGIHGVTKKENISDYFLRFTQYCGIWKPEPYKEIKSYWDMIWKFKGIAISPLHSGEIEYKIYGRTDQDTIYDFIEKRTSVDVLSYKQYGQVVLTAQRFTKGAVTGYNLYYLK